MESDFSTGSIFVINSKIVVELLTTDDKDRAEQIVKYLHSLNRKNEIDIL